MCDMSLIGTKMETKYEGESEESGWTSYLETDYSNVSLISERSTSYSNSTNKILEKDNIIGEDDHDHRVATTMTSFNSDIDDDDEEHRRVAQNENSEEGGDYIEGARQCAYFPDEELESSKYKDCTLSDASSFSCISPAINNFKKPLKRYYPKLHQISHSNRPNHCKRGSHAAAANEQLHQLEDTATSSPISSALLYAIIDQDTASASSISTTFKATDAVSTRFTVLEALIPRLKEVAGRGKEEEMVKVIERHVRDLELKVELLSSAWQLQSQLKH